MPGFTQLCQKVNISIFDDTVTVYPNAYEIKTRKLNQNRELETVITTVLFKEADHLILKHSEKLKVKKFVTRESHDHHLYHQDGLNANTPHYHLKYKKSLNEAKLGKIIAIFEHYGVLDENEGTILLESYRAMKKEALEYAPPSKRFFRNLQNIQNSIRNKFDRNCP